MEDPKLALVRERLWGIIHEKQEEIDNLKANEKVLLAQSALLQAQLEAVLKLVADNCKVLPVPPMQLPANQLSPNTWERQFWRDAPKGQ